MLIESQYFGHSFRFSGFVNMHAALRNCDFSTAADEMYDSAWRVQVCVAFMIVFRK